MQGIKIVARYYNYKKAMIWESEFTPDRAVIPSKEFRKLCKIFHVKVKRLKGVDYEFTGGIETGFNEVEGESWIFQESGGELEQDA